MKNYLKQHKYLIGILALGLIVRLVGLMYGYPYILNIDEPALVRSALGIRFSIWVDHFDWPHLNFYLHYIFYEIFIKFRSVVQMIGLRNPIESVVPILWDDPFIFYALSRFLNSTLVVLSGIPLYLVSRKFTEKKYALMGLLIYLLIPLSITLSKLALQEPAQLFFLAWALYFAVNMIKETKFKNFILFGVFVGLAASVKYNAGVFGFLPVFMYLVKKDFKINEFTSFMHKLLGAGFISIAVFAVGTFSLFKYWGIFWSDIPGRGLLWQLFENISPLSFEDFVFKLVENFNSFRTELSPIILALVLCAIVYIPILYFKHRSEVLGLNLVFVLFFCAYFVYTSRYGRSGGHYLIPIYIFIPVLVSTFIYIADAFVSTYKINFWKKTLIVGMVLILAGDIFVSQLDFILPNNIVESVKYVKETYPKDTVVYIEGEDLGNVNAINNLGFNNYQDDSKIEVKDIVISEETINRAELEIVKTFGIIEDHSINIYVKNQ